MNGFLLIDKPKGWTSHDVLSRLRRITGQKKSGHTGTLDPNATGLLLVALGECTKLIPYLENENKSYRGTILFGQETDSCDVTGNVIHEQEVDINKKELENVIPSFIGEIEQAPPIYSARKVKGKKLYEYAREGKTVEIQKRPVVIENISLIDVSSKRAVIDVDCSKGTYIRSLARDIGKELGVPATLEELRRIRVGNFNVDQAISFNDIEKSDETQNFIKEHLIAGEDILKHLPKIIVKKEASKRLLNGNSIRGRDLLPFELENGTLVRVGIEDLKGLYSIGSLIKDDHGAYFQPARIFKEGI